MLETAIPLAVEIVRFDTNPKRKRGNDLISALTLRVSVSLDRERYIHARTREEIVERLLEQAADAAALRLDPKIADVITRLLSVSGTAEAALKDIRALTKDARITLDAPLAAMEARLAALKSLGIAADQISFAARFGRNMEYYTGFVFELWARDKEGPVQLAGAGAMTR